MHPQRPARPRHSGHPNKTGWPRCPDPAGARASCRPGGARFAPARRAPSPSGCMGSVVPHTRLIPRPEPGQSSRRSECAAPGCPYRAARQSACCPPAWRGDPPAPPIAAAHSHRARPPLPAGKPSVPCALGSARPFRFRGPRWSAAYQSATGRFCNKSADTAHARRAAR